MCSDNHGNGLGFYMLAGRPRVAIGRYITRRKLSLESQGPQAPWAVFNEGCSEGTSTSSTLWPVSRPKYHVEVYLRYVLL